MKRGETAKRTTAAALLAALLCAAAVSCGESGTAPAGGTSAPGTDAAPDAAGTETQAPEEDADFYGRAGVKDTIPAGTDLGGRTVRVLCRTSDSDTRLEFLAGKETGDVVEDAVYRRNAAVSERLNCSLEVIEAASNRHDGAVVNDLIAASIPAGEDAYDLVANHMSQITPYILKGMFVNLASYDYPDFSQPWWNASYNTAVTIGGKTYMAAGELGHSIISGTFVTFFNKKVFADIYGDDNLYDVVKSGAWTMDRMGEYCAGAYRDINGNGAPDEADLFGNVMETDGLQGDAWAGCAELTFTSYDSGTGEYSWALENDRTAEFLDKIKKLLHEGTRTYYMPHTTASDAARLAKLKEDTALFTVNMLSGTKYLRDMESDYGILPMPKLDDATESYTTYTHNGFSVFAVPVTCAAAADVCVFMEAMCAGAYRTVTPAYYDVALKVKYVRDEEAAEMLDICTAGIRFDFGYLFNQSLQGATSIFREMLTTTTAIEKGMSTIAKKAKAVNKKLGQVIDTYAELD